MIPTSRLLEVKHVSVVLEHVDFLNACQRLDIQLLKGILQLLVCISTTRTFGFADDLSSRCAFTS